MLKTDKLRGRTLLAAAALYTASCLPLAAQEAGPDAAMLVADRVYVTADRTLVAEGNVEAFHDGIRLQAARITYKQEGGSLQIEGPIRIDDGTGGTVLASYAELDRDLQSGILTGARLVLNQQMQLAALQMNRVSGRYSQLYKTAVTSCQVCGDEPPLWQIRAAKVTHDQQEKQLYFEEAQLLVLDVPVFYLPGIRLPDPSLERSTGFLVPSIRTTSNLGTGVKVPYFIAMGDHRDLTLTPYVSSKTRTLEGRYRQAFHNGRLTAQGSFTRDDLQPNDNRGYLYADGIFALRNSFNLEFELQTVSDNAYLADYGFPDLDRLRSELTLTRTSRDRFFRAGLFHFKSLRDSDNDAEQPNVVGDVFYQQRHHPAAAGGELRFSFHTHAHVRESEEPGTETDSNGRDVWRNTFDAAWHRSQILGFGIKAEFEAGVAADAFSFRNEGFYGNQVNRVTPRTALTLRRPMARQDADGTRQLLEPVIQIGWSETSGGDVPIEESRTAEFDQGNLLALSRFPAPDAREEGASLVYGVNWAMHRPGGTKFAATVGQVIRDTENSDFTDTSGLQGTSSDLLLAGQILLDGGIGLTARGLLDGSFGFSKAEFRGDWQDERTRVSGTYLWLEADTREGRDSRTSELWFDGDYQINPNWLAKANVRYDLFETRPSRAGIGLVYSNECVKVDLALNRRYTSNSSVDPSTDFSFSIALGGFLADAGNQTYRRSCKNT